MVLKNNGRLARDLLTTFGKIRYTRTQLVPADDQSRNKLMELEDRKSVFPLDIALGVDKLSFKMTYRMVAAVAREAVACDSYGEASEGILQIYHEKVSVSLVEQVTDYVGALAYNEQCKEAELARKLLEEDKRDNRKRRRRHDDILYIEMDGAMVHVRDKGKDPAKGDPGRDGWRESKHAIAFHSSQITVYTDANGKRQHRIGMRDATGYIGSAEHFRNHLYAMARRNDCDRCTKVIVLADGAEWIGDLVDEMFPYAIHILDKFHAKQNAGRFVKAVIHGKNKQAAFIAKLEELIDNGDVEGLLSALKPYADVKEEGVVNMYTYVLNHKNCMNYAYYESQGYFVGSGAIESANIYLMQDRMKLPGMRWNTIEGQGMLTLKTYYETGRWNEIESLMRTHCLSLTP